MAPDIGQLTERANDMVMSRSTFGQLSRRRSSTHGARSEIKSVNPTDLLLAAALASARREAVRRRYAAWAAEARETRQDEPSG